MMAHVCDQTGGAFRLDGEKCCTKYLTVHSSDYSHGAYYSTEGKYSTVGGADICDKSMGKDYIRKEDQ